MIRADNDKVEDVDGPPLDFEEAMQELEMIVRKLETGKARLDETIQLYARGSLLRRFCAEKLADAQMRIEQITISQDGVVQASPLEEGGSGASEAKGSSLSSSSSSKKMDTDRIPF